MLGVVYIPHSCCQELSTTTSILLFGDDVGGIKVSNSSAMWKDNITMWGSQCIISPDAMLLS
jgi:hypothetical protein